MISLSKVKELLGITTTTYDTQITALLPVVKADVKRILNHNFHERIWATIVEGESDFVYAYGASETSFAVNKPVDNDIEFGRVIEGTGIPDDTYITEYDDYENIAYCNNSFTADTDRIYTSISIAQWQAIAKMVWFRIQGSSTKMKENLSAKSIGDVSVTFDTTRMNKLYGYPQSIIDDLGTPYQRVG
jgi:uncharacterized membrane protein